MKLEIKGRIECNKFIDIAEQKMDNKGCMQTQLFLINQSVSEQRHNRLQCGEDAIYGSQTDMQTPNLSHLIHVYGFLDT